MDGHRAGRDSLRKEHVDRIGGGVVEATTDRRRTDRPNQSAVAAHRWERGPDDRLRNEPSDAEQRCRGAGANRATGQVDVEFKWHRRLGDDIEIAEKCLQNRVITVPGVAFGSEAKGFLRISFCNPEDRMIEGVNRMKEALSR